MAAAGFNPQRGPAVFEKMEAAAGKGKGKGGGGLAKLATFFSTHPAERDRVARLRAALPSAQALAAAAKARR